MRILGLIPARGGSKGVPGKNIKPFAGRTLVERAYESAARSGVVDRVILSTDDSEIAEIGCRAGIEVPFMRPAELAGDSAPMIDVAVHALKRLAEDGYSPDALLLLQPTSPLRKPEHIVRAVRMLEGHDSVCSVIAVPRELCPHYLMRINESGYLDYFMPDGGSYTRRQDVPPAYKRDGAIFLTLADIILRQRTFYGNKCVPLVLESAEYLPVDTPEEWEASERAVASAEKRQI